MLQKKIEEIVSNKYFSKDKKREYHGLYRGVHETRKFKNNRLQGVPINM